MSTPVYLLKLKQIHSTVRTETDYIFKSVGNVCIYLEQLWLYWQQTLSEEDFERIPPLPCIGELKAGLAASEGPYEIVSLGFIGEEETLSVVLTLAKMDVY